MTISQELLDKADNANDLHDHDELHAASVVADILDGHKSFAMLETRDKDYLSRWVLRLLDDS